MNVISNDSQLDSALLRLLLPMRESWKEANTPDRIGRQLAF
jgi:hypothetical protein